MKQLFTFLLGLAILAGLVTSGQAQQINVTSITPSPVCAGATITATYSYTLPDPGNVVLYLNGPNTTNLQIGAAATNGNNGSVSGTIPADRPTGAYTVFIRRNSNILPNPINSPASSSFTVNARPVAPTTTPVSVCQGTTPVSLATGVTSGTNLKWYTSATEGTGSSVAPIPSTSTVGQTSYYVSQVNNNGCESDRSVITFMVNGYPAAPGGNSVAYCQNATATSLTATSAANATLNFYLVPTSGTPYTALTPSTASSNNYYVSQTVNGCESQARATITVSIRSLPPVPVVTTSIVYCQLSPAAPLSATAITNFSLAWYGINATGGTSSALPPTPSTSTAGLFHYYVSQIDPLGCASVRADIPVTVSANPVPVLTNNGPLSCSQTAVTLTATGGSSYTFTNGSGLVGTPGATNTLVVGSAGSYSVTVGNESGCRSTTSTAVERNMTLTAVAGASASFGLVGSVVSLSASGGNVYQWIAAGGAQLSDPATTSLVSATLTASGLQTFTVIVSQGTCSQTLTVGVTAIGLPDLVPILYVTPGLVYGNSACSLVIKVVEVSGYATSGLITVYITRDPLLSLGLDGNATVVGGRPVQNNVWSLDGASNANFYILTTSQSIGAGGRLSVGLSGQLSPGNTKGNLTVSGLVLGIPEQKTTNNAGAVKVDYFNK